MRILLYPKNTAPYDFVQLPGKPTLIALGSVSWQVFKNPIALVTRAALVGDCFVLASSPGWACRTITSVGRVRLSSAIETCYSHHKAPLKVQFREARHSAVEHDGRQRDLHVVR